MEHSTTRDFLFHLNQGNYQAALDIAKDLGLDTDVIYKTQWTKRSNKEPTVDDTELLAHVQHDKAWVVSQCLETIVNDASLQQKILDIGLSACIIQQANSQGITDDNEPINDSNNNTLWLRARLYLLQYTDRLKTFNLIWPTLQQTTDFATAYSDFRDANLIAQAIEYAQKENATALRALFVHHGSVVLPYRFSILAAIPETAEPSQFDLPQQRSLQNEDDDDDDDERKEGNEDEWVSQQPWRTELDIAESMVDVIESPTAEHAAYMAWIGQQVERSDYPASADTVTQWYVDRSTSADRIGLASQALEWIRYARLMDVTGLNTHEAQLDWLCKYVYSGGQNHMDQEDAVVDLETFKKTVTPYEVLETLLNQTDATRIVDDMKQLVLPWLSVCNTVVSPEDDNDEPVDMILYRWLLDAADCGHFDWCCLIFEHSKPTLPEDERIIKKDEDLARLALAMFYTTPGSIEAQVRTFESLPVFDLWELGEQQEKEKHTEMGELLPLAETPLGLFTVLQEVGPYGLTQMMDTLQVHLQYAEVLARYHASVSLRWYLEDHSVDTQRQMCVRLASQAGSAHLDDDKEWRELLEEMMGLQGDDGKGVFAKLSRTEIFETFFSSLLRCGRFRLAKDLMIGPNRDKTLDIGRAEQLVLDAEQEFFDNATTGSMYDGNMKLAMECLNILPPTDMVNEEKDLIVATHTLISEYHVMDRPGIELMPIQVRQSTNRLDMISKLINSRRGIYRQPTQVLDLTHKLGYQDDLLAEVQVFAMLASAALVDEDYEMSYKLCCATVDKARSIETHPNRRRYRIEDINQAAWQACFNLGKVELFENPRKRLDVLAMALELTPAENVSEVLSVWRRLDCQVPPSDLEWLEDANQDVVGASAVTTRGGDDGKGVGLHSLLDSARRQQWRLSGLLGAGAGGGTPTSTSPEPVEGKRKRDQIREMMGGWLF